MTQRTHWIPERWREALADLRDDIYDVVQRWVLRREDNPATSNSPVPVPSHMDAREEGGPLSWRWNNSPVIDLEETDDNVVVVAELPGLDATDFSVELSGERLMIRGEKKHERHEEQHGYRYHERRYGAFARAIQLPCEVDGDNAHADYRQGVLRVTLPKTARAKTQRTTIHING